MPRLKKPPPTEEEQLRNIEQATKRIIEHYMIDSGMKYQMDLADRIGMNRGTLCHKMRSGAWTQRDLCKIIKVLKIPAEAASKMICT